jgi:hypothetical protein
MLHIVISLKYANLYELYQKPKLIKLAFVKYMLE